MERVTRKILWYNHRWSLVDEYPCSVNFSILFSVVVGDLIVPTESKRNSYVQKKFPSLPHVYEELNVSPIQGSLGSIQLL